MLVSRRFCHDRRPHKRFAIIAFVGGCKRIGCIGRKPRNGKTKPIEFGNSKGKLVKSFFVSYVENSISIEEPKKKLE